MARWEASVVPGSPTGELADLTGRGSFEAPLGSRASYELELDLPANADPALARLANLLGAWTLAVSDRVTAAAGAAAGRGGQAPAAIVALDQFAEGGRSSSSVTCSD